MGRINTPPLKIKCFGLFFFPILMSKVSRDNVKVQFEFNLCQKGRKGFDFFYASVFVLPFS